MSFYKKQDLMERFHKNEKLLKDKYPHETEKEFAKRLLAQQSQTFNPNYFYDVCLFHSFLEAEIVLQLKYEFEQHNLRVIVMWHEDYRIEGVSFTKQNAKLIRNIVKSSKGLIYAVCEESLQTTWMAWILGLCDGQKIKKAAIVPVLDEDNQNPGFYKQDILGIYPYIDITATTYWVTGENFAEMHKWLDGSVVVN
jgi:hypothetical protein